MSIDYLKPKKSILTNLHTDLDYNYLLKILPNNVIPKGVKMKHIIGMKPKQNHLKTAFVLIVSTAPPTPKRRLN